MSSFTVGVGLASEGYNDKVADVISDRIVAFMLYAWAESKLITNYSDVVQKFGSSGLDVGGRPSGWPLAANSPDGDTTQSQPCCVFGWLSDHLHC